MLMRIRLKRYTRPTHRVVVSTATHRTFNPEDGGSNPSDPNSLCSSLPRVAQW